MIAFIADVEDGISMKRTTGTVKWFNDSKGFGFVESEEHNGDVFIHYSQITNKTFKTLLEGAVVEFDLELGPKGAAATNLVEIKGGIPKDEEESEG